MRLDGIRLGGSAEALVALGLDVADGRAVVGGVTIETAAGTGLLGLDLRGVGSAPFPLVDVTPAAATGPHPVGAVAVDHVVVLCGDVTATIEALGTAPRRLDVRDDRTYGFVVAETALLEFVGPATPDDRPAHLWGLAFAVADLDAAASWLGDACGPVTAAVQPGRRIATVRHERLGLTVPTVLLSAR